MRDKYSQNASTSKNRNPNPRGVQSRLIKENTSQTAFSEISLNESKAEETRVTFHSPWDECIENDLQTEEEKLEFLADTLNLPCPIYRIFPSPDGCIYAQVKIGEKKYASFPQYAESEWEAIMVVIHKALSDLEKELSTLKKN